MNNPNPQRQFLTERYQQLWDGAIDQIRHGQVVIDPLLARRELDQRRSLAVLLRPSPDVQEAVTALLDELRQVDPEQYHYHPTEFHVTVLSLFTATLDHARLLARFDQYLEAVNAALVQAPSFEIEFTGVTLSREAIMIQGFPENKLLNDLREALRGELRARNLTEGLDSRYVLKTTHITVVRFRNALRDGKGYARILEKYRNHPFGRTAVNELHLVRNDWYVSTPSLEVLKRYALDGSAN